MRPRMALALFGLGAVISAQQGLAAETPFPNKPIRIIVGFPPGGAADIFARLVGQKLTEAWKEQVVVDNRPGAGSTIGSEIASKANPDGYTLLVVSASFAGSAGLYANLNFDPVKSFAPVSLIASTPNLLLAHPSVPARSARELIAMAKANPGKFNMGSSGTGSITHLSGVLFTEMAGINVVHVPYKGGAPSLTDLIGGQIQLLFLSVPASMGQIKAGRVKALGVSSARRSPVLPDVPTIAESGVAGYEARNWYGLLAPAGTPGPIINRLNRQLGVILRSPDVADSIDKQGADAEHSTPDAFRTYLKSEITKWTRVIKDAGLRAQ